MNKVSGIDLLQNIKNGRLKDNSEIKVVFDDGINQRDVAKVIYKNDEFIWQPGEFKVSMLYDDYYEFEIIEDNDKLEKIKWNEKESRAGILRTDQEIEVLARRTETLKKKIAELVDHVNKIEENKDER